MAGWTCPECHRQFGRRNQSHECAPSGSVEAFFAKRPPVQRKIFDKLAAHLHKLGPVVVDPVARPSAHRAADEAVGASHRVCRRSREGRRCHRRSDCMIPTR